MNLHVSGLKTYLKCQRLYEYSDPDKLGLQSIKVKDYFFIGKLVHSIMEGYYNKYFDNISSAFTTIKDIYINAYGGMEFINENYSSFDEDMLNLSATMIYYEKHHNSPLMNNHPLGDNNIQFILFEHPFSVKVARGITLSGRIDGLVRTGDGRLWILEHKTSANPGMLISSLETEMQTLAYIYAVRKMGYDVKGVLYNIINKSVPKHPKVLKNLKLSKEKTGTIAYISYLESIRTMHADWSKDEIIQEYKEILTHYADFNNFYIREAVTKTSEEINNFIDLFIDTAREIKRRKIFYPTGANNPINCSRCMFRYPCIEQNQDIETNILSTHYTQRTDRSEQMHFINRFIVYRKNELYGVWERNKNLMEISLTKDQVITMLKEIEPNIKEDLHEVL